MTPAVTEELKWLEERIACHKDLIRQAARDIRMYERALIKLEKHRFHLETRCRDRVTSEHAMAMRCDRARGLSVPEIATKYRRSAMTVYRKLREAEQAIQMAS